jgi:hypothetical protein
MCFAGAGGKSAGRHISKVGAFQQGIVGNLALIARQTCPRFGVKVFVGWGYLWDFAGVDAMGDKIYAAESAHILQRGSIGA